MPTQKIFKQRVRARMAKTGEAYTTARAQLLRKAAEPVDKGEGRPSIAVTHDQIADHAEAERLEAYWRERLVALKSTVERD